MDHKFRINDNDILDYLMTSDFNDGYSIDESRYLLHKFRQFYRILQSNNQSLNHIIDTNNKQIVDLEQNFKNERFVLEEKISVFNDIIINIKNKKLSVMERINGKINIKNDTK